MKYNIFFFILLIISGLSGQAQEFIRPGQSFFPALLNSDFSGTAENLFLQRLEIDPDNKAPKADAGDNLDLEDKDNDGKEQVGLDGSGSEDHDGTIVSYSWSKEGTEIAEGVKPTVELPTGSATIELTVTDDGGLTDTDEVRVRIKEGKDDRDGDGDEEDDSDDEEEDNDDEEEENENEAPDADAGEDQEITDNDNDGQERVELDGSESADEDGTIESYSWSLAGAVIATGVNPVVTLPVGSQQIVLTVTDDDGLTDTDEVEIKINEPANQAPEADAGNAQEVTDNDNDGQERIELDGSKSKDKDGTIVSYSWTINGEEIATGETPAVSLSTGEHTIRLTVTDDDGLTDSDEVAVTIHEAPEKAPVADAGEDQVLTDVDGLGELEVELDGSESADEDGTIESYSWSLAGAVIATGVNPVVTLPVGSQQIVLTVTDDDGLTDTDEVEIKINEPANQAPEADAGNAQEVTDNDNDGQERIELDGSKSKDKDGTIVSYSWTINGEEIATGETPAVSLSTGEHTIRLTVTDDDGLTDSDEVAVTIHEAPEKAPVADAGEDQVLTDVDGLGELEVELDGSESADEDGTIESYSW
ncbi:PKD domain-containing protein, partial [Nafulsella turpanensis]|uniref:PKD domain-containing protein n=1 Tax=Nafulsella turpanensis TaxID=1265690 RepID=UPI0004761058